MVKGCWVFGGVERIPTLIKKNGAYDTVNKAGRFFSVKVRNRDSGTLLPLIRKHIAPGSIVISDKWGAYNTIRDLEGCFYEHLSVNHSKNFKDPTTQACTNTIEGAWRAQFKAKIPVQNYSRYCLGEYLNKRLFLHRNKARLWTAIWELLAAAKYSKIVKMRTSRGGSFKKKHAEEEKIRIKEEAVKKEQRRLSKIRSAQLKELREERKRKRDIAVLEKRKKNKALNYFLGDTL